MRRFLKHFPFNKLFVSLFVILYTFVPSTEAMRVVAEDISSEIDTSEDILDEGISDPPEIANPNVSEEEVIQEVVPEATEPLFTYVDGVYTVNKVVVNEEYVYPDNSNVRVKFTNVSEEGNLVIKRVELTQEEKELLNTSDDYGWDISSNMINGSFKYDLTLPNSTESNDVEVKYSEDGNTYESIDNNLIVNENVIEIKGLEHFTVFVVVDADTYLTPAEQNSACGAIYTSYGGCYTSIQDAINAATDGATIYIGEGTYEVGQVLINKNLTIQGVNNKETTIIKPSQNTSNSGDARGWFLVNSGKEFNLSNVTLDGSGFNIYQAIRSYGSGTIENNIFKNMYYDSHYGWGIAVMGSPMTITRNSFSNIERIGIHVYGTGASGSKITNNTFTGNGDGDYLQYGIEVNGGATGVDINGNTFSSFGTSTTDWGSAGILVDNAYGGQPSSSAIISNNDFEGNEMGIKIGYEEDQSDATISDNTFTNNRWHVDSDSGIPIDLYAIIANNTFINPVIVNETTKSIRDKVDVNVINETQNKGYNTIQEAIDAANDGDTINITEGIYDPFKVIEKNNLTIQSSGVVTVSDLQVVTTNYGNRDAVIFVDDSIGIVLDGLEIGPNTNKTQQKDYGVIYENSSGRIENCTVSPYTNGDMNSSAIGIWDSSNVTIDACTINNFGRIGVFIYNGCTVDILGGSIEGQVYSGEDEVCYGVEVEGAFNDATLGTGSQVLIDGVEIYNCDNTFTAGPSWVSSGVYINGWMEYYDEDDSTVTVRNCDIHDNYIGIIAINSPSSSAHSNNIYDNRVYGVESMAAYDDSTAVFDATNNWWGSSNGPNGEGPGSGDAVSGNVEYCPWLNEEDGDPVGPCLGDLRGRTFIDEEWNGLLLSSDGDYTSGMMSGFTVRLYDESWNPLEEQETSTTGEVGQFHFANLDNTDNTYYVCGVYRDGYFYSPAQIGQKVVHTNGNPVTGYEYAEIVRNESTVPYESPVCWRITLDSETDGAYLGIGYTQEAPGTPEQTGYEDQNGVSYSCMGDYTKMPSISVHWEVEGIEDIYPESLIKYQRQYSRDGNNWSGSEIYTNNYTDFRSFGFGEVIHYSRVRSFYDLNENNQYDSGEPVSGWSDSCGITYDKTPPEKLEFVSPDPTVSVHYFNYKPILNDWINSTDPNFDHYEVKYVRDNDGVEVYRNESSSQRNHMPSDSNQTGFTVYVRAVDKAGNTGEWSNPVYYIYDITPPDKPEGLQRRNVLGEIFECGDIAQRQTMIPDWDDIDITNDPSFSHFEYSSFNADGSQGRDEDILYVSEFDNSWTAKVDGTYGYAVRSVDKAGNKSEWSPTGESLAESCQITYDSTPPAQPTGLTIKDYQGKNLGCSGYTNNRTITVDWDNNTETDFHHYIYGIKDNEYFKDPWSKSFYSGQIRDEDGVYRYIVRAVDNIGNTSIPTDWCQVTLDRIAPVVDITSHENNDLVHGMVTVSGTIEDLNLYRYWFVITDSSETEIAGLDTVYSSDQAINASFDWDTEGVSDGTYTIKLEARDLADNKNSVSIEWVNVIVDNTAPIVEITLPIDRTNVNGTVDIKGSVQDENPYHYSLVIKNSAGDVVAEPGTIDKEVSFTDELLFQWDTTQIDVEDGLYTISLVAEDAAGNREDTVSLHEISVTVDNTPPVTTLNEEISGIFTNDPILIKGNTTDNPSGVDFVNLYYNLSSNSVDDWVLIDTVDNPDNDSPFVWEYEWIPPQEGTYDIKASATDTLGNEEQSAYIYDITYDLTSPTVLFNLVFGVLKEVTAEDLLSGVYTIQISVDNMNTWVEYTPDMNLNDLVGNQPGTYTIHIRVTDKAGNTTIESTTFTIPSPAPTTTDTGEDILGAKDESPLKPPPVNAYNPPPGTGGYLLSQTDLLDTEEQQTPEEETITEDNTAVKGEEDNNGEPINQEQTAEEKTTKWWIYPLVILPLLAIFLILWKRRKEDNQPQL